MKKFIAISLAASLAASLCVVANEAAAADLFTAPVRVTGEKMDSGLGDLPHYSKWTDRTGKNPLQARAAEESSGKTQAAVQRDGNQRLATQISLSK